MAKQWYINYYTCPRCETSWESGDTSMCNDECPDCGLSDVTPIHSEQVK